MKLFFVKGKTDWDEADPILVLADTKEEAEELAKPAIEEFAPCNDSIIFEENAPDELGKAGEGYELKKGVIWKQYNAG